MTVIEQISGTLWNVAAVLLGSSLGLLTRGRLPERIQNSVMQALGLVVLYIGFSNAADLGRVSEPPGVILGLVALALGVALGEWWGIEGWLETLGEKLKRRFRGKGRFTEGFVAASLLFCVGPLTLIGAIQNGLSGDDSFLLLKSGLDFFSSMLFAATFGFGVMFSVLIIAVYQSTLSLGAGVFAALIPDPAADPRVLLINGVGGLMIMGIGFGLAGIKQMRTASMAPSLLLIVALYYLGLLFY